MKVQRLLGSLAVAGTLTALTAGMAAPAFAANGNVTFSNIAPSDQAQLPGSLPANQITVHVDASCPDLGCSIGSLAASISDGTTQVASATSGSSSLNYTWDLTQTAKRNGVYTITFSAQEKVVLLGGGPASTQSSVKVNVPPVAPSGVQVTLDSSNVPVVTWNANPEPDIKGYQVYRSDGAQPSGVISGTSFRDASAPQGQAVAYKVAALRYSPVGQSNLISSDASAQTSSVSVPAAAAAAPVIPQNVATVDPPKPVKTAAGATAPTSVNKQPVILGVTHPTPINGPTLPTQIVQAPQPNVIQFAPLLPYSGKIPEVATTSNVPAPVAAQADTGPSASIQLPGGVKVTPVDAIKYVATASFLIVAAVHITRFARKLKNAPV